MLLKQMLAAPTTSSELLVYDPFQSLDRESLVREVIGLANAGVEVRRAGDGAPLPGQRIQIWAHTTEGHERDPHSHGATLTDANGNTTEQLASDNTGRLYGFNSHNRLMTATDRSITLEGKGKNKTEVITDTELGAYAYNGLGQRTGKTDETTAASHYFLYGTAGELLAEELRLSQQALGTITGEVTADDLLGRIFSEFCIGK